jgi:hypothetical protein
LILRRTAGQFFVRLLLFSPSPFSPVQHSPILTVATPLGPVLPLHPSQMPDRDNVPHGNSLLIVITFQYTKVIQSNAYKEGATRHPVVPNYLINISGEHAIKKPDKQYCVRIRSDLVERETRLKKRCF